MNKKAIHMQLYSAHFEYGANLIKGFYRHCKDVKHFRIFVFVDTETDVCNFKNILKAKIDIDNVDCISLESVLNSGFNYIINPENYKKVHDNIKNKKAIFQQWGTASTHSRTWMSIKRSYGILELEKRGYNRVWCVDAESYPLVDFNIKDIFKPCEEEYTLSITENGAWNDPNIATKVLKKDTDSILTKIGVRINDFWIIDTSYFKQMIQEISNLHKQPVSYFVRGCEQALYEIWLYDKFINKEIDIKCITFSNKDFTGIIESMPKFGCEAFCYIHSLLMYVINNDINIEKFAERLNNVYFNYIQCYRGDMIKILHNSSPKGQKLLSLLNLKFAVSNWQGH